MILKKSAKQLHNCSWKQKSSNLFLFFGFAFLSFCLAFLFGFGCFFGGGCFGRNIFEFRLWNQNYAPQSMFELLKAWINWWAYASYLKAVLHKSPTIHVHSPVLHGIICGSLYDSNHSHYTKSCTATGAGTSCKDFSLLFLGMFL